MIISDHGITETAMPDIPVNKQGREVHIITGNIPADGSLGAGLFPFREIENTGGQ